MSRTTPTPLLVAATLGAVAALFAQLGLQASGRPVFMPPVSLALALATMAAIIIALAVPVARAARGRPGAKVDPFYATRVVLLAKASSITGALLSGAALGNLGYLLTRTVTPEVGSLGLAVAAAVAAVILVVSGLVAEHLCKVPPDADDGDGPERAAG